MQPHLTARADANPRMGTGHVMRCLALAQSWKARGGEATFVTCCESRALRDRLVAAGMQVVVLERSHPSPVDWERTSQVIQEHANGWLVLDGYQFDAEYQRHVKQAGRRLLVIDDAAQLQHYHADIVLNQNANASVFRYSAEPYTRLLLGTQYALLRPEFLRWAASRREIAKTARRVLITLGGADADNQTLKVIRALQETDLPALEAVVVVGAANPHRPQLEAASRKSTVPIEVVVDATNMDALMAWADVAVAAAGTTCWELAFMGLPALLIILADNQRVVAEGLHHAAAAVNLGWHHALSATDIAQALMHLAPATDRRLEMSRRGRALVDGQGNERVLMEMSQPCSS